MESDSCDDSQSDSGVSADFSPCITMEGNTTISPDTPAAAHKETPIEREIRRAIEREHSLRRSRGLPNPPTLPEYVEIPYLRKSVLCQSVAAKSERCQGRGRQFAGKKMQHEIQEEVRREQDLVKLGKVPGVYDKGTVRQLKERKRLFEAFQTPRESNMTTGSKAVSWSSTRDVDVAEDPSLHASTTGGSYGPDSLEEGGFNSLTPRGPGLAEGTGCQVIILENNLSVPAGKLYRGKPEAKPVTAVGSGSPHVSLSGRGGHGGMKGKGREQGAQEEAPKGYPFFKLRSSTNVAKVERDIQEAKERERELQEQRISLYGNREGSKGGERQVGRAASTEEKSPMLTSSLNGLAVPGPPAASQSVGKLVRWPPAQAEEERTNRSEVLLRSPRTPRQKSPLVKRWESGLVNGHDEEDN